MASLNGAEKYSTPIQEESDKPKTESEFPFIEVSEETEIFLQRTNRAPTEHDEANRPFDFQMTGDSFSSGPDSNSTIVNVGDRTLEEDERYLRDSANIHVQDGAPDPNVACLHQVLRKSRDSASDCSSSFDRMSLRSLASSKFSTSIDCKIIVIYILCK